MLILVSILQSVLLGLLWGYGSRAVMYVMPVVAALVPPLGYAGVSRLVRARPLALLPQLALFLLPALLLVLWRDALDVALALIFLGHAAAIPALMRPGTNALQRMPFENTTPAFRSILFAAFALRRKFSRQFKIEAARLVAERGVAVVQAARDLDVEEILLKLPVSINRGQLPKRRRTTHYPKIALNLLTRAPWG